MRQEKRTSQEGWLAPALVAAALILCTVVTPAANIFQLQPGSLCEKDEKIVFSCTTAGKAAKIVSLCSSKELTKDRGYLQYRFGLPGKIELEYPQQREQTQTAFKYSHYFRAQVDQTEISFTSGAYQYTIFDDYSGEQKPARHDQGIRITPNMGKEITLNCRGKVKAQYSDLAGVFPEPE
jgi:hypothetical protein